MGIRGNKINFLLLSLFIIVQQQVEQKNTYIVSGRLKIIYHLVPKFNTVKMSLKCCNLFALVFLVNIISEVNLVSF